MKFIIKHEIPGRIRVHMVQPKMTFEEADILLYYLVNLENVTKAKVYERTQDAVIYYEKDRREIIKALQKFGYDRVTVPEGLTEHSGRQMNAEYQEKLQKKKRGLAGICPGSRHHRGRCLCFCAQGRKIKYAEKNAKTFLKKRLTFPLSVV